MHTSSFFKLFPPPQFLLMKHTGLDISDDAIHSLTYATATVGLKLDSFAHADLPEGLIDGGDIRNEDTFVEILKKYAEEHHISYVKVSLPEEKVYLFQTDVPNSDVKSIGQNIEFKLEENVPLTVSDAVFYYDIFPASTTGGTVRASVSVAPRIYIEKYISLLARAGLVPIAFEVTPKAIARAVVPPDGDVTYMIIYSMNRKTGIYIVSGGVVCFTSTVGYGTRTPASLTDSYASLIGKELNRIYSYWISHDSSRPAISEIILAGRDVAPLEASLEHAVIGATVRVVVADTWRNIFDLNRYIPPISHDDSLEYVAAAGLGMTT